MSWLDSVRDAAAEGLAEARRARSPRRGDLLWWEIRGRCRLESGREARMDVDGGLRVERVGPGGRRESSALVGFPAGAARRVAGGDLAPRPGDREAWRDVAGGLVAVMRAEADRVRQAAGEDTARRAEAHVRVRAWCRGGRKSGAVVEGGVRLGGAPDGLGHPRRIVWSGAWGAQPPAREAELSDDARSLPLGEALDPGALPRGLRGPVTLLPGAAAWWVHEMGHAAAESRRRSVTPATARGLAIADDPTRAPWPHGFSHDDDGVPSGRAVLWDDEGCRPFPDGHARRASLTAASVPSLACTVLETGSESLSEAPLRDGEIVVDDAVQGRFDPSTGRIFLVVGTLGVWEGGFLRRAEGGAILSVGRDEGWRTVRVRACGPVSPLRAALCTRLGAMSAVMVGAPTLTLGPVQLLRWNLARDAGFPRAS